MKKMPELAERAVEAAKVWKLDLDYSAESLEEVDELAQEIFRQHLMQPLPEDILLGAANLYGAYLGEVLLRCGLKDLDFAWVKNEEGEFGIGREDMHMWQLTKVYKRITKGPEHSLFEFFDCVFGIVIGYAGYRLVRKTLVG